MKPHIKPEIKLDPLSYIQRLDKRPQDDIRLLVIHCTELPDMAMARTFGEKVMHQASQTGNSGHFYIDRDGSIEQWVPLDRVAHHVRGFNPNSIGIELVNNGRYPDWFKSGHQAMTEPYPAEQITSLVSLLNQLEHELPRLTMISGHEDLDTEKIPSEDRPEVKICRKVDPGPHFPWQHVLSCIRLRRITLKDL